MAGRGQATKVLHQLRKSPRLANINPNQNTCRSTPPSSPTPLCKRPRPSTSSQYGSSSSHRDKLVNPQDTELSESSQVAHFPTLKEDINATSSRSSKKRRGQTLGIELSKKRRSGDLVEIDIPEHIRRAVGNNCQSYITNLGCIVRRNAPLQVDSWKKIERKDVTLMMRRVREKFNLSNEPHVIMAIEDHMKRRYYTWRYNLHKKFLAYGSEEEALEHRPQTVGEDDWNYLVQLWQKDEWKKSSAKNKENRKKLKITHCAGTKAFSRIRYENRNSETGEEPSRIDLFQLTRFSTKKTTWVGEDAKNAFDEMKKLKNLPQTDEESVELMSDYEIYDSVLSKVVGPPRSGYIRGLGAGPKPKTFKAGQYSHAIVEEAKRRADEATKRADDAEKQCMLLANELTEMKENSAAQKYQLAGLQARQNETDELLKRLLQQLSSTSSSMRSDE